ncbi:MAG: DUF1080 domain-containing protein [Dysgonamonadaceae bacterium]|jgi:hypothetical protein|nr:DUF1080 domain-containing protein [Dysgonamonadaceae bacterium]
MKKTILFASVLLAGIAISCTPQQKTPLFNGTDLSNWNFVVAGDSVAPEQVFSVENGTILIKGDPFGYMYTKEKYADYTLEVEWRWRGEATNSGIFLLIADPTNPFPNGIECQLKDGQAGDFVLLGGSDLKEYTLPEGLTERPPFPVINKMNSSSEKTPGEWNKAKIDVKNGEINVYINDVLQNKGTNPVKEGYIGLQSEGKEIQFRNIILTK